MCSVFLDNLARGTCRSPPLRAAGGEAFGASARGGGGGPRVDMVRPAMEKFTKLTGVAAPLNMINVDTDMIIPKQFLKTIKRTGLGSALFHEMRTTADGAEN